LRYPASDHEPSSQQNLLSAVAGSGPYQFSKLWPARKGRSSVPPTPYLRIISTGSSYKEYFHTHKDNQNRNEIDAKDRISSIPKRHQKQVWRAIILKSWLLLSTSFPSKGSPNLLQRARFRCWPWELGFASSPTAWPNTRPVCAHPP
jgi:hypothetical protein